MLPHMREQFLNRQRHIPDALILFWKADDVIEDVPKYPTAFTSSVYFFRYILSNTSRQPLVFFHFHVVWYTAITVNIKYV